MSFLFRNNRNYTNTQKKWIGDFEADQSRQSINVFEKNKINNELDSFKNISDKYENKEEVFYFFIREYLSSNIKNIEDLISLRPNDINKTPIFKYGNLTNADILNKTNNKIKSVYNYLNDDQLVNSLLNNESNKESIENISIDKNLSKFIITLLEKNVELNHNKLLNMSIRHANKDLFDATMKNFKGEKANFENNQENPFFWQPLIMTKNNQDLIKYFHNELFDHGFKLKSNDLKSMIDLYKNDPYKIRNFHDLENTLKLKNEKQLSFKLR